MVRWDQWSSVRSLYKLSRSLAIIAGRKLDWFALGKGYSSSFKDRRRRVQEQFGFRNPELIPAVCCICGLDDCVRDLQLILWRFDVSQVRVQKQRSIWLKNKTFSKSSFLNGGPTRRSFVANRSS